MEVEFYKQKVGLGEEEMMSVEKERELTLQIEEAKRKIQKLEIDI